MISRSLPFASLLLLVALATAVFAHREDGATTVAEAPRYGFEVVLASAGTPGSYRLNAAVRELEGGTVVANPRIVLPAGKPGRASAEIEGTDHVATVDVTVAEDGRSAEIVFQVVAGYRSLTHARTLIELPTHGR